MSNTPKKCTAAAAPRRRRARAGIRIRPRIAFAVLLAVTLALPRIAAAQAAEPSAPTTNTPVDAVAPAGDAPSAAREGALAPPPSRPLIPSFAALLELEAPRPTGEPVVIPTDLEPGTPIPPTRRAAAVEAPAAAAAPAASGSSSLARARQQDPAAGSLAAGGSSSNGFMDQVVPTALALAATLAVIFFARMVVKRFGTGLGGGKRPSGVVEVLARYPFARGHHIVLIKVGRRILVTHQSTQGIQTLSEFSSPSEVADLIARCEAGARGTEQFSFDALLRANDREFDAPKQQPVLLATERKQVQRAARPNASVREALPKSVRTAEIETIDLTKRRGALR